MSYAIIRNTNYKIKNLNGIYRHIERKNTNYSNKNINKNSNIKNYSLKVPSSTYEKLFNSIKEKYNLKGQIKNVSNVACEYIITSDKDFFDSIGIEKTKKFFKTAYSFVCNYKDLGEQYILSAKVHMDEKTPIKESNTTSLELVIAENKKLVKHCNRLREYCITSSNTFDKCLQYEKEIKRLKKENLKLKDKIKSLNIEIKNIIFIISQYFNISIKKILNILQNFKLK